MKDVMHPRNRNHAPMRHARVRALQRVPGVCPGLLVRGVQWAILNNRRDILQFERWQDDSKCVWLGVAATGQKFTAIANPATGVVVTIIGGCK